MTPNPPLLMMVLLIWSASRMVVPQKVHLGGTYASGRSDLGCCVVLGAVAFHRGFGVFPDVDDLLLEVTNDGAMHRSILEIGRLSQGSRYGSSADESPNTSLWRIRLSLFCFLAQGKPSIIWHTILLRRH